MQWTRERLQTCTEDDLRRNLLIPLFKAMGYRDVQHYHGGSLERGKDVVMWRPEPPRHRVNYAVVAKRGNLTGTSRAVQETLAQVQECFGAPYQDRISGEEHSVDHCYVVASGRITKEARQNLTAGLRPARLERQVSLLAGDDIWELVAQNLPRFVILESLRTASAALEDLDEDYRFGVDVSAGRLQFRIEPKHASPRPLTGSFRLLFPDTPEGRKRLAQFERFQKAGETVEIPAEYIDVMEIPEPLKTILAPRDTDGYAVTLSSGPTRPTHILMSLSLHSPSGHRFELPYVDFAKISGGTDEVTLSNDGQPIPFHIGLTVSRKRQAKLQIDFNLVGRSFKWLLASIDARIALAEGCTATLAHLERESLRLQFQIPPGSHEAPLGHIRDLVQKVCYIQHHTRTEITVPDHTLFTPQDVLAIENAETAIRTGILTTSDASFDLVQEVRGPIDLPPSLLDGTSVPIKATHDNHVVDVLGTPVSLGPIEVSCPAAAVHPEDIPGLRDAALDSDEVRQVSYRLVPTDKALLTIKYLRWTAPEAEVPTADGEEGT